MANRNNYRVVLTNDFLGASKELSAPTMYELNKKIENQKRIWNDKIHKELVRQDKEEMKLKAEQLSDMDTRKINAFSNILNKRYIQVSKSYYDSLTDKEKYQKYISKIPVPNLEEIKKELNVPKKSFLELFSSKKKNKRIEKEKLSESLYNERLEKYNKAIECEKKDYEAKKSEYLEKQRKYNENVENNRLKYQEGDVNQIEKYFEFVLEKSVFPNGIVKQFELQYVKASKTMVVSYYLPNSESVPNIIQHKYVSSRNEIDEIKLSDKKFEKFYNNIVYMFCLRTISEILSSDDSDNIDNIVYNGYIRYVDKSTGKDAESCIITIETTKEKFLNINLDNIDCKECIKGLKGIFAPSILSLTPVTPYMKIDRSDSRFIESKDVSNITLDGFNLATMPWEDFEYFVRELFDKMFNQNGGEVKVTQASHDGGVDAIAFDDDPIRGGKFVIQAKRYNNAVPVSAVRDLYGTMIHEGATKGILVTTSSYGKESYDFAKDKPITLIDGQALLGLLNKYGYDNLTIRVLKK